MRVAAVFGTRDKIIVDVIREAIEAPVKWFFSFEEIFETKEQIEYDWVVASTSAPYQGNVLDAIKQLQNSSNGLIIFAKEPLLDEENIHWIIGKHFTVKEIKERLLEIIGSSDSVKEKTIIPSEIGRKTPAPTSEIIDCTAIKAIKSGVLCAIGQEDIEARLEEANINITGKAKNAVELLEELNSKPEMVILSVRLKGLNNLKETAESILSIGSKLVLLVGDIDPQDPWILSLQNRGVKVIFDPVKITDLLKAVNGSQFESVSAERTPVSPNSRLKTPTARARMQAIIPVIQPLTILNKAKDNQILQNLSQKFNWSESQITDNCTIPSLQTKVFTIVGATQRVGATSFALALAEMLRQTKCNVELLDACGGASDWYGEGHLSIRRCPPYSVTPGFITIVDAGLRPPEELMPFTEAVFIVTDLSRNALNFEPYKGYRSYLVGTRGVKEEALKQVAGLWQMDILCCLPEDGHVRDAERTGVVPLPKTWQKQLWKMVPQILEGGM